MTAREAFEALKETFLVSTVRSKADIEKAMELHRMAPGESLSSHIATMCRFFRGLHLAGQILEDEIKIVKTMCKMTLDWYKLAEQYISVNDRLTFARFRARMIQMEADSKSFKSDQEKREAAYLHSHKGRNGQGFKNSRSGQKNEGMSDCN